MESQPREVVILGSTGSIGTQALDIVRRNPGRFRVVALAAGGGQPDLLASQAAEFGVAAVAEAAEAARKVLRRKSASPMSLDLRLDNAAAAGCCPAGLRAQDWRAEDVAM